MGRKSKHIKLNKESRIELELELGYKKGKHNTFRQRCHYILLNADNYDINSIRKLYKTSRQTIGGWLKRYEEGGINSLYTAKGKVVHQLFG